jgi:TRAP-type mannitol/chloroaromatic compound transport system permease small subunit
MPARPDRPLRDFRAAKTARSAAWGGNSCNRFCRQAWLVLASRGLREARCLLENSAHRSDDAAAENKMRPLLAISTAIDLFNEKIGYVCNSLVLLACLVSAANAMVRYAFDYSSNGWLELQWYMFAILVMFGASYTFKRNEHVRVEIFYLFLSERAQLWLDLLGTLLFLIPACLLLAYLSWPFFMQAYAVGEMSGNAGGLIRWPIKFVIPAGFVLLALQGVSEVIKRAAALRGYVTIDAKYERPLQ